LVLPFYFFTESVTRIRARALADGKRGVTKSLDSTFATVRQLHDPIERFESGQLLPNFFEDLMDQPA